jgi:hypothetical protein
MHIPTMQRSGNGPPNHKPTTIGEYYYDLTNKEVYVSTGAMWIKLAHESPEPAPIPPEETEPMVCKACGDILYWTKDHLPVPGYLWKRSSWCPATTPQTAHKELLSLTVVKQQIDEIERLWRNSDEVK